MLKTKKGPQGDISVDFKRIEVVAVGYTVPSHIRPHDQLSVPVKLTHRFAVWTGYQKCKIELEYWKYCLHRKLDHH